MTKDKDFKAVVRARAEKTGESYTTARSNLAGAGQGDGDPSTVVASLATAFTSYWNEFRPGLRGLTNDEYLWQPAANCPTVREHDDGTYRVEGQFPVQGAASIAQRLCWIGRLTIQRTNQHFGDKTITSLTDGPVPGSARPGVEFVEQAITDWTSALGGCPPKRLLEHSENTSPGSIDGQFPLIGVVLHQFQLLVQCGASISVTREWYLQSHPEMVSG